MDEGFLEMLFAIIYVLLIVSPLIALVIVL